MSDQAQRSRSLREIELEVEAEGREWTRRRLEERLQQEADRDGKVFPPQRAKSPASSDRMDGAKHRRRGTEGQDLVWAGPGHGSVGLPDAAALGLGPHQEMSPALEDKLAFTVTATRPCGVIMNKNSCPVWTVGADILVEMNARGLRLLEQYTRQGAEEAFAALVREHLDLVYSAALRAVHSPQLAEEVAQAVFTDLARQAHKMKPNTLLSAWLYRVTRRTAIDVVRRESRRQRREQVAVELAGQNSTASSEWTQAEPLLDEAMDALPEADRNAVLLRFFEGKDLKAVGGGLGVSEEAARKRVARAVERLRQFFSKRGVEIAQRRGGGPALRQGGGGRARGPGRRHRRRPLHLRRRPGRRRHSPTHQSYRYDNHPKSGARCRRRRRPGHGGL